MGAQSSSENEIRWGKETGVSYLAKRTRTDLNELQKKGAFEPRGDVRPFTGWLSLYPCAQEWLLSMGRIRNPDDARIEFTSTRVNGQSQMPLLKFPVGFRIDDLRATGQYGCTAWGRKSADWWAKLAQAACVYYVSDPEESTDQSKLLNFDREYEYDKNLSAGQLTAVVGPVCVVSDRNWKPVPLSDATVLMVSVSGINLDYSPDDIQRYVPSLRTHSRQDVQTLVDDSDTNQASPWRKAIDQWKRTDINTKKKNWNKEIAEKYKLDSQAFYSRMVEIWYLVLRAMDAQEMRVAVVNAIGCGAFAGPFPIVPYLVAKALCAAAAAQEWKHLQDILVCLLNFDEFNRFQFEKALGERRAKQDTPCSHIDTNITLLFNHSSIHVASDLAKKGVRVATLNPSDPYATRKGHIGMYFDGGGHIALEELLAVGTTMLTMNRYINPNLWEDKARWKGLPSLEEKMKTLWSDPPRSL